MKTDEVVNVHFLSFLNLTVDGVRFQLHHMATLLHRKDFPLQI